MFVFLDFNSIKVRLKQTISINPQVNQSYFNSIKVRLKQDGTPLCTELHSFQFHKGTIKTSVSSALYSQLDCISIP